MNKLCANWTPIGQMIGLLMVIFLFSACGGTLVLEPAANDMSGNEQKSSQNVADTNEPAQNPAESELPESNADAGKQAATSETAAAEVTAVPTETPMLPATEEPTPDPTNPPTAAPTTAPTNASQPAAAETSSGAPLAGPGFACFGFDKFETLGITCLGADGQWQSYDSANSPLQIDFIYSMASCTDNTILIQDSIALHKFDGVNWTTFKSAGWGFSAIKEMACDAAGNIWLATSGGVSHFDGANWTTYDLQPEEEYSSIADIIIAENGDVWAITTTEGVGHFDGTAWTIYDGSNFGDPDAYYSLRHITLDNQQRPWVLSDDGFMIFDGTHWELFEFKGLVLTDELLTDANGVIWAAINEYGVLKLDTETREYAVHNTQTSPLTSDYAQALDIDQSGRIWMGTKWGVNVFDGSNWIAYHMDNAPLTDHFIRSLAVAGSGPNLPNPVPQGNGSMVGRVMLDGRPIGASVIEICPEKVEYRYQGDMPCSDQDIYYTTTTDEDGRFAFTNIPRGRYVILIGTADGWAQLRGGDAYDNTARVPVLPGEETYLGEILFASDSE